MRLVVLVEGKASIPTVSIDFPLYSRIPPIFSAFDERIAFATATTPNCREQAIRATLRLLLPLFQGYLGMTLKALPLVAQGISFGYEKRPTVISVTPYSGKFGTLWQPYTHFLISAIKEFL